MDTFSGHIIYVYFIRTVIDFSYVKFTYNSDLTHVHLFDIPAISSGKSQEFFSVWRVVGLQTFVGTTSFAACISVPKNVSS